MITSITASVFIGALLWMDREYALQIQISRPVVISAILGLVMGNIQLALIVGVSLEIIGLYAPPHVLPHRQWKISLQQVLRLYYVYRLSLSEEKWVHIL